MNLRRLFAPFAAVALLSSAFTACNSDSDSTYSIYNPASSVAVNGFSLTADSKVLSGLDSVFFSIDLNKGLIFNADSLPKGTKISALIPIISLPTSVSSAVIHMEGGEKRTGDVDYIKTTTDSIDFTGSVSLVLTSQEGNTKTYQIKVNVHTMEPDSLWWGTTALSALPSRLSSPREQRTVNLSERVVSFIAEQDGTYTIASTTDPFSAQWAKRQVEPGFTPQVRTMQATSEALYMLSTSGTLYRSTDGLTWSSTDKHFDDIIGAYGDTMLGTVTGSQGRVFATYPTMSNLEAVAVPSGFPVSDYTNFHTITSKWWQQPYGLFFGGKDKDGNLLSSVWAYDGENWAQLANGGVPALSGAALLPYFAYRNKNAYTFTEYSILMVLGGKDADGNLNRSLYISYDNGVNWSKAGELLQLPEFIPGMINLDAITVSTTMTGNYEVKDWTQSYTPDLPSWYKINTVTDGYNVTWDCPYIYLFGGRDASGSLYDTVWRGVIRRLTFLPLL